MDEHLVKTSKFLSLVLRHNPHKIGLKLDQNGWAEVDQLIALANQAGKRLTRELLHEVVETNEKQRFALSPDGQRIRANQGHSITIELDLPARQPPETLFHGTARQFLASIRARPDPWTTAARTPFPGRSHGDQSGTAARETGRAQRPRAACTTRASRFISRKTACG